MSTADRAFEKSRTHWWHLPSFLVASYQAIIINLCVFALSMGLGIPQLFLTVQRGVCAPWTFVAGVDADLLIA